MPKLTCSKCGTKKSASKDRFEKLKDDPNYLCRACRKGSVPNPSTKKKR